MLLVRCTPDPVFRLQAQAPDSTSFWQEGRRVVTQTVDSVQVAVAYGRTTDAGHKFRLAFVNRSRTSVTATPRQAYAVVTRRLTPEGRAHLVERGDGENPYTYRYRHDTLAAADTVRVRDPEQRLLEIEKAQAREDADARTDAAAQAFFLTLDAVGDEASAPRSPEERMADAMEETERQLRWAEAQAEHRQAQMSLGQRRAYWARAALCRTALMPGQGTSGFVDVPVDPDAVRIVLHVDLGSQVVTVPFRQTRYEP